MEATKLLTERRSVRKYKNESVPRELMAEIVDIARWAPSWANFQIARYTIIDSPELIAKVAAEGVNNFAYNIKTLENAKGVVVLSFVKGKSGKLYDTQSDGGKQEAWEMFDAGIACQTFCLAAHAKGVGTCIFGVIDHDALGQIAQIPEGETVAALITYGFEEGDHAAPTPRKETEEIMRFI